MNLDKLFKDRKLRKIGVDIEKAKSSLMVSEKKIVEGENLFDSGFFDQTILSAYTSMFHSARALLYKDGIQEKSHYAVYVYLDEKYSGIFSKSLINSFYNYQSSRKEMLYGFDYESSEDEARDALVCAKEFLEEVKKVGKL
ncbi:MAG: HEPN domain-containing protein [Nanoarchaeota archaeon]|nr:HEPN domain-containing protein [Nanoarchaeota archaeon]